jgi:toxin-antitoxin system PIN domain toxin
LISPDVNILVYAFRDDALEHPRYRDWLLSIVNGEAAYAISPQVLSSVVRICTHPGIFARPNPLEDALRFCETVTGPAQCQLIQPGVRHWHIFADLCLRAQCSGNLVQDAWLAALAIENGCEWITADRDFSRFPGLRWRTAF